MVTTWRPSQIVFKEYKKCGNGRHFINAILVDQGEVIDQDRYIYEAETRKIFANIAAVAFNA
jgi:hypothetical protein